MSKPLESEAPTEPRITKADATDFAGLGEIPERRVISVQEAAGPGWLNIGRRQAYQLARAGRLPGAFRLGGRILVSRAALERFIDNGGQQAGSVQ